MAFLSHLRPNNNSKKPITKRKTSSGINVTKATPRVPTITPSVATAASAPTIALRQLVVILATRTRVNASTNSTAEARNAATTIAHCISYFLLFSMRLLPIAFERPAQVRQRAIKVGFHGRLRHVECLPDFGEGQLPETAQEDDRTKHWGQGTHRALQQPPQIAVLGQLLRQRLSIGDGLKRRQSFSPLLSFEGGEKLLGPPASLAQLIQAAIASHPQQPGLESDML